MVIINRFLNTVNSGIFGELFVDDNFFGFTKELPWIDNKKRVSCIPEGEYYCRATLWNKKDCEVYEVQEVPNRRHIYFHYGSYLRDTSGCILYGGGIVINPKKRDNEILLTGTKDTHFEFMKLMKGNEEFKLLIRNSFGGK